MEEQNAETKDDCGEAVSPEAGSDARRDEQDESTSSTTALEHEIYRDERKVLRESEELYAERFDKWIMMLSSGAIVVSITFVKDLVSPQRVVSPRLLFAAWLAFGASIGLSLIGALLCQRAREKFGDDLDTAFCGGGEDPFTKARELQDERTLPKWIIPLNYVNLGAFLVGIVLLGWFVYVNLNGFEAARTLPTGESTMQNTDGSIEYCDNRVDNGVIVPHGAPPRRAPVLPPVLDREKGPNEGGAVPRKAVSPPPKPKK